MDDGALRVYHDYVDPFSYLMEPALRRLEEEGAEIAYRPLEVNPPPGALLHPDDPEVRRRWEEEVEPLAGRLGVEIHRPDLVPWTRKAHELALHARTEGCFRGVHDALYRAHFVDGRDIGRIDVLVEVGVEAGMETTDARVVLDLDQHRERLLELEEEAAASGVDEPPAVARGGRLLRGFATYDDLLDFFED